MKLRFLLLAVAALSFLHQAYGQERASRDVRLAMEKEWISYPRQCLEALKLYGTSKAKLDEAVKELEHHQDARVRELYRFASARDADGFFKLLAGAFDSTSADKWDCAAADQAIQAEYESNVETVIETSKEYHATNDLLGLHRLLLGLLNESAETGPKNVQKVLACYSASPLRPFQKVDEILGVR